MKNRFDRTISLLGKERFKKFSNLSILVVGLGGVGGSVCEALIRSGLKKLTVVDFDKVDLTNINRQVLANETNIDENKSDAAYSFLSKINSKAKVKMINTFVDNTNASKIIKNYDYVIDCIDSTNSKIAIYKECINRNIKIISSMGTANKIDATKIELTTLNKTSYDPLAKKLRSICVKENVDMKKINVCYSNEKPITDISKPLPSMMMVPTAAAMTIVSFIIKDLFI